MARLIDLEDEALRASKNVDSRHIASIQRLGCTAPAIAAIGSKQLPFGVMRCDMRKQPYFEPTEEPYGIDAVIMPVMHDGTVIDLIAWRSLAPDAWLWRHGDGWALGIDAIKSPSAWDGFASINIHGTPLQWLRSGGTGAVVLDWSATSHIRQLALFDEIRCDDQRVCKKLRAILERPARMPRIVIDTAGARNAA